MSKAATFIFAAATALAAVGSAQGVTPPEAAEEVEPGWLGVALEEVDGQVTIDRVLPGSPAERAGLVPGDVVTAFNGEAVGSTAELVVNVGAVPAGTAVQLTVAGDNPREVDALLTARIDPSQIIRGFVGRPFPEMTLTQVHTGEAFTMPPEPGQITVVDFWATWCGSCVRSIPRVAALEETYGDRIQVIGIAAQTPEQIIAFEERREPVPYTLVADPEEIASTALWVTSIPAWMVLDADNEVIGYYSARQLAELESDLAELMAQ